MFFAITPFFVNALLKPLAILGVFRTAGLKYILFGWGIPHIIPLSNLLRLLKYKGWGYLEYPQPNFLKNHKSILQKSRKFESGLAENPNPQMLLILPKSKGAKNTECKTSEAGCRTSAC